MDRRALSLLESVNYAYVERKLAEIEKRKLVSRRELVAAADNTKADLRFIKKVARFGVEQVNRILKPRGRLAIPKDKYLEFMDRLVDSDVMLASRRKSALASTRAQVFNELAGEIRLIQAKNHKAAFSSEALGLAAKLRLAVKGKSNVQLVLAGVKSGYLSELSLGSLADQVKEVADGGDPKELKALLKALKEV